MNKTDNDKQSTENGLFNYNLSIFDVVFIVFLILKIGKIVNWSWWIIFSPVLISVALILLFVLVFALMPVIKRLLTKIKTKKQKLQDQEEE